MMIYFRGLHEAAVMKGCLACPSLRFAQPPFSLQHFGPSVSVSIMALMLLQDLLLGGKSRKCSALARDRMSQ